MSPLTADVIQTYGALHAVVATSTPGDHPGLFPTPLAGSPVCDEFLVYNKNHCLPRFWIELAIALIPSVAAASKVSTLPAAAIVALSNQVYKTIQLQPSLRTNTLYYVLSSRRLLSPTMTPLTLHARPQPDNTNTAAILLHYSHHLTTTCPFLNQIVSADLQSALTVLLGI